MVYALNIQHHQSHFYFFYGLMMQMLWRKNSETSKVSSAAAHNTRFALGNEWATDNNNRYFLETGYNYSPLRYFDTEPTHLYYLDLCFGRVL